MKIAIVSHQFDSSGMAYALVKEGNEVKVWVEKYDCLRGVEGVEIFKGRDILLDNFIIKHRDSDLIIFDGSEYGARQDYYRVNGLPVIGSSRLGEAIEKRRELGNKLAQKLGIKRPPTHEVDSIDETIRYIKGKRKKFILKQSGNLPKTLNYKAQLDDSEDLILHLVAMKKRFGDKLKGGKFIIEEVVEGIEVATSAFWSPIGWLRHIETGEVVLEVNFEHKGLLDGERGMTTGEMGTVAFFVSGENRIFKEMLKPLEPLLNRFNNWGNVDANCILTPEGDLYLLEWTIRFGYPISDLYTELTPDFTKFLYAIYKGNALDVYLWPVVGIVLVLAFPVFPYERVKSVEDSFQFEYIIVPDDVHFHPGFVNWDGKRSLWYISDPYGYAGTITLKGRNLENLIKRAVEKMESIVPAKKGFYRTDIGKRVVEAMKEDFVLEVIFPENAKQDIARHSIASPSYTMKEWQQFIRGMEAI
jgi:phosphoribosylamine-glycine ligase